MIICFATHKGGAGKTTSAINTSAALALEEKEVLAIDIDPQGHTTKGLGVELDYKDRMIADVLERRVCVTEVLKQTRYPKLALIPSYLRLAQTAENLYAKIKREELLTKILEPIRLHYEWIVIDCPPNLGLLTANAITASDVVIVPCEMGGARALDGLGEQVYTVGVLKGEEFDNWWILPTKLDVRKSVSLDASRQLLKPYKDQGRIFDTEIDICEPLNQSQFLNQDVFAFDGKSKGAEDYRAFAKELISRYS